MALPPFSLLPVTNLELTRAGKEVAESSQAPPQPPRGSPQLWEGLPLMQLLLLLLLPLPLLPLDRPHRYLHGENRSQRHLNGKSLVPCPRLSPGTQPLLTPCLVPGGFNLHPYPVLLKGPPCPQKSP